MVTFDAHFDGESLRPAAPVMIPQNVRLRVTVEADIDVPKEDPGPKDLPARDLFGNIEAKCGLFEGPADMAAELNHYLYGTPKRGDVPKN